MQNQCVTGCKSTKINKQDSCKIEYKLYKI